MIYHTSNVEWREYWVDSGHRLQEPGQLGGMYVSECARVDIFRDPSSGWLCRPRVLLATRIPAQAVSPLIVGPVSPPSTAPPPAPS